MGSVEIRSLVNNLGQIMLDKLNELLARFFQWVSMYGALDGGLTGVCRDDNLEGFDKTLLSIFVACTAILDLALRVLDLSQIFDMSIEPKWIYTACHNPFAKLPHASTCINEHKYALDPCH